MGKRKEPAEPTGRYPVAVAVAVIGAVAGSLWWQTREGPRIVAPADDAAPATQVMPVSAPPRVAEPVQAFLAFAESPAPESLPPDHGYTAEGLRQLAAAIASRGNSVLWSDRAKRLRTAASALEQDPNSTRHADIARETFVQASSWIVQLAEEEAGGARGYEERLAVAARAIRPDRPLREQAREVAHYFDVAAAALTPTQGRVSQAGI